jgi:ribonuclease P protein component
MTRVLRLRPHGEFDRVRQKGRSWSHPLLVIIVVTRTAGSIDQARVSVAAGKKLGGAAVRNRVKRKMRAAIQRVYADLPALIDLIVIARQPGLTASVEDWVKALTVTLQRAQLWRVRSKPTD